MTPQEQYLIHKRNPAFFELELSAEDIAFILINQWSSSELEGFIRFLIETMEDTPLTLLIQNYFAGKDIETP